MELDDFIKKTILDIALGIKEANERMSNGRPHKSVAFMPESIEFDVGISLDDCSDVLQRLKFTIETSQYYNPSDKTE